MNKRLPYVWDYDISEDQFTQMLSGALKMGRLDQEWAVLRLLEYAPYPEIIRLLGFQGIVNWWPRLREKIRSKSRKRGFDFLVDWLPQKHPELLHG